MEKRIQFTSLQQPFGTSTGNIRSLGCQNGTHALKTSYIVDDLKAGSLIRRPCWLSNTAKDAYM